MEHDQTSYYQVARVIKGYVAQYADPIAFRAGDLLSVGQNDTEWPTFVWCVGPDGRSGWTPERMIERDGDKGIALCDYSAMELTVAEGEIVTVLEAEGGWLRVRNSADETGWAPDDCFAPPQ